MSSFKFGVGSKMYTSPPTVQTYSTTFSDFVPQTQRMPGVSGGLDAYGTLRAPAEIGVIRLGFTITDDWAKKTYSESNPIIAVEKARDDLKKKLVGKARLTRLFADGAERFTWARVNSVSMPESGKEQTQVWQDVTVIFQVSDPYWYKQGKEGKPWGEFNWNDGTKWGGAATAQACSGVSTTWTETVAGTAETLPRITILAKVGGCDQPRVQRLVEGYPVDELIYNANLVNGDILEFDCRAKRVILNGIKSGFSTFDHVSPDWFTLEPGANSIRLIMLNSGNAADVTLRYYEAYR